MRKALRIKTPEYKFQTAMLIDDNEMDNFINQKIMEAVNFAGEIYTNTNGLSALEFLKNLYIKQDNLTEMLPDVIFVDLNMPLINGFQFIEQFYLLPNVFADTCKIVILTSSLNEEDKSIAKKLNPNIAFLNKPLTEEALLSVC
ncbi:MAG: response regulator [Bacteroidia bacterium]